MAEETLHKGRLGAKLMGVRLKAEISIEGCIFLHSLGGDKEWTLVVAPMQDQL